MRRTLGDKEWQSRRTDYVFNTKMRRTTSFDYSDNLFAAFLDKVIHMKFFRPLNRHQPHQRVHTSSYPLVFTKAIESWGKSVSRDKFLAFRCFCLVNSLGQTPRARDEGPAERSIGW